MPNWCENEVKVYITNRGNTSESSVSILKAFVDFVKDGKNYFSFDRIIPMPDELKGTRSPVDIVSQEEYDSWVDSNNLGAGTPLTQELSDRFKKEYGCDNWYDWACDNWGTKWDVNCEDMQLDDGARRVEYKFDTAWGPPEPIYDALTEMFPKLNITWFYREDGTQQAGWLK